jgi:glycosyltransferase involved in cell wall biosynthesis
MIFPEYGKRMRIAMISTPFVAVPPHGYGGTELVVYELVEGLVDRGHDVTLYATGDSRSRAKLRALFPVPRWPPEPLAELNHVSWALQEAARGAYDLVHVHSPTALAVGRLARAPMVYTLHHAREPKLSHYYSHFPEVTFVAISADQAAREDGIQRCEVIHHGIDPRQYDATDRPEAYVCFVGRFAPEKGLPTAIDAAWLAGVPIRVAGEPHAPESDYVRLEVEPRLRQDHVELLGPIGLDQKRPLLRNARALLAPIDWNEPFGLILIEALLSGCPVVAFEKGSVRELIEPGVTGFIVHSVDEVADIIRPGGAVERLDRRRIRRIAAQSFGRNRMVAEYEQLYRHVAGRAPLHPISAA